MSEFSLDHLEQLTDLLFDAAVDDAGWPVAMAGLHEALNAADSGLGMIDLATGDLAMLRGECEPYYRDLCYDPVLKNPFLPNMMMAGEHSVFTEAALMDRAAFENGLFYNEWLMPQGFSSGIVANIMARGHARAFTMLVRSPGQPAFDDSDAAVLSRIVPAFSRAMSLRARVGTARLREEATAYERLGIAFIMTDQSGRVLATNAVADQLLGQSGSLLRERHGLLRAATPADTRRLCAMLARTTKDYAGAAAFSTEMVLSPDSQDDDKAAGLVLTVAPLADASRYGLPVLRANAIFVQNLARRLPPGFEARVRSTFGLTAKEAALATALAAGKTLRVAAEEGVISIHTARGHLANLFRKTRTTQQGQLISLLLGILSVRPQG